MSQTNSRPRLVVRVAAWLLRIAVWLIWVWCIGGLYYLPYVPRWLGALLAIGYGFFALHQARRLGVSRQAAGYFAAASLAVVLLAGLPRPSDKGPWSAQHSVMPTATVAGDTVRVKGMRKTSFANGEPQVEHYTDEFQLSQLDSLWFGVQHFSTFKGMAHTFVSFGFSDGRYLSISIESRRRPGENFSPLRGLYKSFGVIYVIGDEQEVIGRRSLESADPLYLYRIRANQLQLRTLLLSMLNRANQLADRPEFYNTLTNNCTNNIVYHANQIAPRPLSPYSPRIAMPGYTGRVAYKHGLIDSDRPFEEILEMASINAAAKEAAEEDNFSTAIRTKWNQ